MAGATGASNQRGWGSWLYGGYEYVANNTAGPWANTLGDRLGNRIADVLQTRIIQPLQRELQQIQNAGQRFTTAEVRDARRALDQFLNLEDTSSVEERQFFKLQMMADLFRLHQNSPPQMSQQDKDLIIDLIIRYNENDTNVNITPLNTIKDLVRPLQAMVVNIYNAQYGPIEQTWNNLAGLLEQRIPGLIGTSVGTAVDTAATHFERRLQPYFQQLQQMQDTAQRFTSFTTDEVRNAHNALNQLLDLGDASTAEQRQIAIDRVTDTLFSLYTTLPSQMNAQDTRSIFNVYANLVVIDVNAIQLDAIKDLGRPAHVTLSALFNTQRGPFEQFADNFSHQVERRLQPFMQQLQQVQNTAQGITSFVPPEVANARRGLEAILDLESTSSADQRELAKRQAIDHLWRLHDNLPAQMHTEQEQLRIVNLNVYLMTTEVDHWDAIKNTVGPMHQSLVAVFNALRGPLQQVIEGSIQTAVNTGAASIRGLFNPTAPPAANPANPAAPAAGGGAVGQSVSAVVGMLQQGFNTFVNSAGDAFSKQAARSVAFVLHTIYTFVLNNLRSNDDTRRQAAIARIRPSIERMQRAQNEGSFSEIAASLSDCFAAFREFDIYFSHIHLGNSTYSPTWVSGMYELGRSLEESPVKQSQRVTQEMLQAKTKEVVYRTAGFAGVNIVKRLGIPCEESFCSELLKSDEAKLDASPQLFRTRIFAHINNSGKNIIVKWAAKCGFVLVQKITASITSSVIDTIHTDFSKWQKKDIQTKGKQVLNEAIKYFSDMSGMYTSVAHTPPDQQTNTFFLLEQAAQSPSRNAGLPPKKFMHALIMTGVKIGLPFNWTKKIADEFDVVAIPSSSGFSFMNPVLNTMTFFCKKSLQALVYIPQSFLKFIAQKGIGFGISKIVNPSELIDSHIHSMQHVRSPIAFALQEKLVFANLKTIVGHVRKHLKENGGELDYIPPDQQLQCQRLMESLLEVLHKSRKLTVDGLKRYDRGDRTFAETIEREVETQVLPEIKQPVAMTLWSALHDALNAEALLETEYDIMSIVNNIYDQKDPITDAQCRAVDQGISELVDELIHLLIGQVIDEKLDINNVRKQEEVTKFTRALKNSTREIKENLERQRALIDNSSTPEQHKAAAIRLINDSTGKFIFERLGALEKAKGNLFLKGVLGELNAKTQQLLETKIQPIAEKAKEMHALQRQIEFHDRAAASFHQARRDLGTLEFSLCNTPLAPQNLNDAARDAASLATHITELQLSAREESQELVPLHNQLKAQCAAVQNAHKNITLLSTIESQWHAFIALKQQNVAENTPAISQAYRNLVQLIQQLSYQGTLLASLNNSYTCHDPSLLPGTFPAFMQAHAQVLNTAEAALRTARAGIVPIGQAMHFYFAGEDRVRRLSTEKRQTLAEKSRALDNDLLALGTWEAGVQDTTILTIEFLNFMKWVQGTVHSLGMSHAKEIVSELRNTLLTPPFFKRAFLHGAGKVVAEHGKEYI
jgi:hypothetical protein